MAVPTASVALNAQKITGLADPTNAQDAVTLNYITTQKGVANGLAELDGSGLVPTHHLPALACFQLVPPTKVVIGVDILPVAIAFPSLPLAPVPQVHKVPSVLTAAV